MTATGEVLNQYDYDIWGNPTLTVETEECSIRFAGEYLDSESGLYYLRARYYNSYTGRFMSEDSYWGEDINPLSLNRYTYGHNNPIMFVDPTGHLAIVATDDEGYDVTTVNYSTFTYQDIQVDEENVDVIQDQMDANEQDNAEVTPFFVDKNQVTTVVNTDADKVSLFAEDGSDELLGDGSDSGKGTYNLINDLSWNYDNYYQELKDLNNSGLNENSEEYRDKSNSILQNMAHLKNQVIDARNNYAWGNPDSAYGQHMSGDIKSDEPASNESLLNKTLDTLSGTSAAFTGSTLKALGDVKKVATEYISTKGTVQFFPESSIKQVVEPFEKVAKVGTIATIGTNVADIGLTWTENEGNSTGQKVIKTVVKTVGSVVAVPLGAINTSIVGVCGGADLETGGLTTAGIYGALALDAIEGIVIQKVQDKILESWGIK